MIRWPPSSEVSVSGRSPKSHDLSPRLSSAGPACANESCAASPNCARSDREIAAGRELLARGVDHPDIADEMRGQATPVPGVGGRRLAQARAEVGAHRVAQVAAPEGHRLEERGDRVGQRHEPVAQRLGQALEVPGHLLADHSGHEPLEPSRIELVEERERHRDA